MNFKSLLKSITSWGKNLDSGYERLDHWDPAIDYQGDHRLMIHQRNQLSCRKLTGSELITKVKDLGDISKTDLATACGYVSRKKDGSIRVDFTGFYEALLNAKGIYLGDIGTGRKLSYRTTVQGNGNLLVGKAYTAMLDLQVGDEFIIKLGKKAIRLIPVGGEEEGDE